MNTAEGLTRIAKVVRWLGYLSMFAIVFLAGAMGTFKSPEWWVPLLMAAMAYGVTLTLAWIIEGFAKPKA